MKSGFLTNYNNDVNTEGKVYSILEKVMDPEIPVLSVMDLGMITGVEIDEVGKVIVKMTPTFIGCPAIDIIKKNIKNAVIEGGFAECEVKVDLTVAWNSNRMTDAGKEKLEVFGLAAPEKYSAEVEVEQLEKAKCPNCGGMNTMMRSFFGSALCRSIHFCYDCRQSFEKFKPV